MYDAMPKKKMSAKKMAAPMMAKKTGKKMVMAPKKKMK